MQVLWRRVFERLCVSDETLRYYASQPDDDDDDSSLLAVTVVVAWTTRTTNSPQHCTCDAELQKKLKGIDWQAQPKRCAVKVNCITGTTLSLIISHCARTAVGRSVGRPVPLVVGRPDRCRLSHLLSEAARFAFGHVVRDSGAKFWQQWQCLLVSRAHLLVPLYYQVMRRPGKARS